MTVFPKEEWGIADAGATALENKLLDAIAMRLGSRGCIVKDGFVVKSWGSQSERGDWASSAKPVLSTLLMFARKEGKVASFDQPIAEFGWELSAKDRTMTFRHLANMISGYARPEPPGTAWAYNDYAIQLYQKTLFDRVFRQRPEDAFHAPERFGALGLQDGFAFRESNRRMRASVRDFARVAWLWHDAQLLPQTYFDEHMRPQVPLALPLSAKVRTDDYLKIGTYGGESNHFSDSGPGIYGFNWWFNARGGSHPRTLTWPDAPPDTVMSIGVRGNCSVMIPSRRLLVVAAAANWGEFRPGQRASGLNQLLGSIAAAGTSRRAS